MLSHVRYSMRSHRHHRHQLGRRACSCHAPVVVSNRVASAAMDGAAARPDGDMSDGMAVAVDDDEGVDAGARPEGD